MPFNPEKSPEQARPLRVVGNAPEAEKEKIKAEWSRALMDGTITKLSRVQRKKIEIMEYPKTENEGRRIEWAQKELNDYRERLGLAPLFLPEQNYHILPNELFNDLTDDSSDIAVHYPKEQMIYIRAAGARRHPIIFSKVIDHETYHNFGYYAMEAGLDETDKVKPKMRQSGITVGSSMKDYHNWLSHTHFGGVEEALAVNWERITEEKAIQMPEYQDYRDFSQSEAGKNIKEKLGQLYDINPETVIFIDPEFDWSSVNWAAKDVRKEIDPYWKSRPYRQQLAFLEVLIDKIVATYPERLKNEGEVADSEKKGVQHVAGANAQEVWDIFYRAHFSGQLLPLARLMEEVFGKNAFRKLGGLSEKQDSVAPVAGEFGISLEAIGRKLRYGRSSSMPEEKYSQTEI